MHPYDDESTVRGVGRPRVFSDEDIFQATQNILARDGFARLTLDSIAEEVGCTRQALVRRFGSKTELISCYLTSFGESVAARAQRATEQFDSPLEALRFFITDSQFAQPLHIDQHANLLFFLVVIRRDPEFRCWGVEVTDIFSTALHRMVQAGVDAGEFHESTDVRMLAHMIDAAALGEIVLWASNPVGDISIRLGVVFNEIVRPHRTRQPLNQSASSQFGW